jgi:AsmA protein
MRMIKGLIIGVGIVLGIALLGIAFITLWVDPNDHKPELQRLAAKQGIDLQLAGDLSWQFFPSIGVTLNNTRIASLSFPDKPVATLEEVLVAVEVMPLLQRQLRIEAVSVTGAVIDLQTDLQARNNWDISSSSANPKSQTAAPSATPTADQPEDNKAAGEIAGDAPGSELDLAIARLSLRNVSLSYQNFRTGDQAALEQLQVLVKGMNDRGDLFPITLSTQVHKIENVPALAVDINGELGFHKQRLQLQGLRLAVAPVDQQADPVDLSLQGELNLAAEPGAKQVDLQTLLKPLNVRPWLALLNQSVETADPAVLTVVGVKAHIQGLQDQWQLNDLQLQLDDTQVTGSVGINQAQALPLVANLAVDKLNVDRYLPPSSEPAASNSSSERKTSSATSPVSSRSAPGTYGKPPETRLPLDSLRQAQFKLSLAAGELQVAQAKLSNLKAQVRSNQGVAYLDELTFDSYDGRVDATGHLDGRRAQARLQLDAKVDNVELLGLLGDTLNEKRLQGAVSTTVKANSAGSTVEQLQRQLAADIQLQAQALQVNELDIERDLCDLAASLGGSSVQGQVWKGYTHLQDLSGQFSLRDEVLSIASLTAGVEALAVKARGSLQLTDQSFDIPLDVNVIGQRDETLACQIRDRWRNQDLPLRCRGSLDTIGARTCLPDKERLGKLLESETKQELQDKLSEKLKEKLGDEDGKQVETLLRGLFGR